MLRSLCLIGILASAVLYAGPASDLKKAFQNPPDDSRIMMRWWWFGPGVTKAELEKEMRTMKAGGIGGFEVQPVYPLALDDAAIGFKNLPYLSDEFLEMLRFTSEKAHELGLRMDMTLCSGWPYGGPYVTADHASHLLRIERIAIKPGEASFAMPDLTDGERLIAAFLANGKAAAESGPARKGRRAPAMAFDSTRQFTLKVVNGRAALPADLGNANTVLIFISSLTGQQVKRAAAGAEGFVLDHYSRAAVEQHLKVVGDRLMTAFGSRPPYAVFSDSLEVYAADWTPDFLQEFKKRRGYDLTPYLPALAGDIGPKTLDIRHDWGKTLTELVDENYLTPINEWARQHGTKFRSQTYGYPPVMMSSNALVALPEGEGPQWRSLSSTRWASSASHLYGRPVTSSETWTWLHSPVFRATPLDMKAEADLHFLEGINQLIGHGWPYSPEMAGEPGWRFYAAAVFNNHNPWWIVMPDITKYLQRVSFLLRQGKPANDVAIYLATDDAWAHMQNGQATINNYLARVLNPELIPQILDAGYNFDFIDDKAIASVGIPYKILVLPDLERMPAETKQKIEAFKAKGGVVVTEHELGGLAARVQPDFAVADSKSAIGVVHRKVDFGDLYFIVNTSNQPVHTKATVRANGANPQWWDAMSGEAYAADMSSAALALDLAPYESRILVLGADPAASPWRGPTSGRETDLSSDWIATPGGHMDKLHSLADDPATKFYSGQITYRKTIDIPAGFHAIALDFGEGTALPDPHRTGPGMHALMESPVHEAAVVTINGQKAGSVWHPPYQLDITKFVHAGKNEITIVAGNLALNEMAGQMLPSYRLLNLRYGERFQAQDMQDVKPMPSGLTTLKLVTQ